MTLLSAAQRQIQAERARELISGLQDRGVRQLAITFVNHAGLPLVKAVPLARLPRVAAEGVGFSPVADAFGATGAIDPAQSLARPDGDLRLVPDLDSLALLDGEAGWGWLAADRHQQNGEPYAADQRLFCRDRRQALEAAGLEIRIGGEIEWVLLGDDLPAGGPYGADRLLDGLDYLGALAAALDAADLPWLQLHPEYGPAQFELSLAAAGPLAAADRLVLARLLIQRVSRRFGWRASFSPLVAADRVGNGGHVHLSLRRGGEPLLSGGAGVAGLTAEGEGLVAVLLESLPALLALACPLVVSYRRLQPSHWAAPFQVWGVENREAALRLIPGGPGEAAHLELKIADAAANPYLLLGALMALAADDLARPRPLPAPLTGDPVGQGAPRLPNDLPAAITAFAAHPLLSRVMGPLLHRTVIEAREAEVRRCSGLSDGALIASTRLWPPSERQVEG